MKSRLPSGVLLVRNGVSISQKPASPDNVTLERRQLIALHGAVSAEVAEHMARGLLANAPIDWALSVTGIAGPTGGTEAKPVGTVWLALVHAGRPAKVWRENFDGDRQTVRHQTVRAGLTALCEALEDRDN